MDRETSRSRGFGFVTFASADEASAAIQALNGQELEGLTVTVNYANERPRDGGFSGYGGGYGAGGGGNFGGDNYNQGSGNYNQGYNQDGGNYNQGYNQSGDNYNQGYNQGGGNYNQDGVIITKVGATTVKVITNKGQ